MGNRINLAELLKDCPKGMELDCTMFDGLEFDQIDTTSCYPIKCRVKRSDGGYNIYAFNKYGHWNDYFNAKCVIFPKGKTTWEGFEPPCKFKDGDIVYVKTNKQHEYIILFKEITDNLVYGYVCFSHSYFSIDKCAVCHLVGVEIMRLATEAETEKILQSIKVNGYKWNAETKTLEKLIVPKFKGGDKVKNKDNFIVTIARLDGDYYDYVNEDGQCGVIYIRSQDEWELVSDKFDINTLKPFESRVLVRDKNTDEWRGHFFSHYDSNSDRPYVCIGVEGINEYKQCVPYKDNEHLLGKTYDCSIFYKTWE